MGSRVLCTVSLWPPCTELLPIRPEKIYYTILCTYTPTSYICYIPAVYVYKILATAL